MANQERKKFAYFIPIAARLNSDTAQVLFRAGGSSHEDIIDAAKHFETEFGGTMTELTERQTEMARASFYFSADNWKAQWQPTGHKPNWKTEDGTPIQ